MLLPDDDGARAHCDARRRFASFSDAQAAAGREQRAAGGRDRGELGQACPRNVDVDRLDLPPRK